MSDNARAILDELLAGATRDGSGTVRTARLEEVAIGGHKVVHGALLELEKNGDAVVTLIMEGLVWYRVCDAS